MLRKQLGGGAGPIGEVVPEVMEVLGDVGPLQALEPDEARFRLFDSITGFLKRASEDSPILLVLDDLHWADLPSLLLLEFVARQLEGSRILITGTYRDNESGPETPLGQSLARLARMPSFQRQPLTGLPSEDAASFVRRDTGFAPPEGLLNAIHAHTEGNPFFLGEVVRYLSDLELLDEASDTSIGFENLGVPEGIRDVIGQRLTRLSEPCNAALNLASVIGREFDLSLLERLTENANRGELLDLMDEAASARIIDELPRPEVRYQFRHALLQQTLVENMPAGRKAQLHARIGEALESAYGENPGERAAELAHHFTQAAPMLGSGPVLRYTLLAGEQALASHAHEVAVEHFERGLSFKAVSPEGTEAAEDSISAELLFGLGRSQNAMSGHSISIVNNAVRNLKRAFDFYRTAGETTKALEVAQFHVRPRVGYRTELIHMVGPGAEMAVPGSADAANLLTISGVILGLEEARYPEAQEALDRAMAIADDIGDKQLKLSALSNAANVQFFNNRIEAALESSLEAVELSSRVDDPKSGLFAHYIAFFCLLKLARTREAAPHASAMRELAAKVGDNLWAANAYWLSERAATVQGEWDDARAFSDLGLSFSPNAATLLSCRAMLEFETGEVEEGTRFLERLLDGARTAPNLPVAEHWTVASTVPVVARVSGITDRLVEAEMSASIFQASSTALPILRQGVQEGMAMLAVIRKDPATGQEIYDDLLSQENTQNHTMSTYRLMGLLANTIGSMEAAMEHFEESLAFCRRGGFRPELAWTCHDYAEALLTRGGPEDLQQAGLLIEEGLAIATALGMTPLMATTSAVQNKLDSMPSGRPANPGGLSQREVEVLQLISGGKTDREIGEELFISVKTVGNHVGNILNKTGAANRAEAASFAALHGIVSEEETG